MIHAEAIALYEGHEREHHLVNERFERAYSTSLRYYSWQGAMMVTLVLTFIVIVADMCGRGLLLLSFSSHLIRNLSLFGILLNPNLVQVLRLICVVSQPSIGYMALAISGANDASYASAFLKQVCIWCCIFFI